MLLVVVHHAFPQVLKGGFIGVDLFFVISGFLISSIIFQNLQRDTFSFLDFYKRRVKRIFPALSLILITSFVYGWFVLLPSEYKQLGKHMAAGAAFVSNFAFWNESGYFDGGSKLKPLLHLWSLGVEEQYYIVWPVIVWLVWKRNIKLLTLCLVLFVLSFAFNVYTVKGNSVAAFYSPVSRFWELLIGSVLAYMKMHHLSWFQLVKPRFRVVSPLEADKAVAHQNDTVINHALNHWSGWVGALLLVAGVALITPESRFPGSWALFPTLAAYLMISAGPQAWFNRVVLSNHVLVWVGLISFPLYLWHWPLLVFAELHAGQTPSISMRLLMIAAGILLAWLTYRLVERPIRFGKDGRRIPLVLCGILLATALAGGYTYLRDGFDFRFPNIIRALTNNKIDMFEGWRLDACILQQDRPASDFSSSCVEKKRPLVFLWGDSHAAALYPGFKKLQESGEFAFGMAQRNGAVCPPMLAGVSPWCKSINEDSFKLLKEIKPDIVLLYAYWAHENYDLSQLDATVAELKLAGVPKIILMGSTPLWKNTLPQNILDAWKKGPAMQKPPLRMTYGLDERLPAIDAKMQGIAQRLGISYISGYKALCNEEGCLTRNGEDGEIVASTDYGHLTVDASQSYIKLIASQIFSKP